ncbi:MAG: signal recognition particle subunit [Candidatus Woesearchaeota archaeon]|nr:signal recognition particle subunit [Candidatus Woesearchaeota archaeon]
MVLDKLGESLRNAVSKIKNAIFVDEKLLNTIIKELQRALIQADVNVKLVFDLSNNIKKRFKEEKPIPGLSQKDLVIKILYEELANLLGGELKPIEVIQKPFKIFLVGLFGSGKTTTAGKLANYFAKRGYKIALVQTDTWRPAAYEQLKQLGERIKVPVFGDPTEKDPLKIYKKFEKELNDFDIVIIDTAGRDALSDDLIEELNTLYNYVKPQEVLLVLSADIGQTAEKQATKFHEAAHITGVIITKLDGTAKGGGALTACSITNAKVKFIGTGEKINDFEPFDPKGFVGRLLGLGDLNALLEKAKEAIDEEEAKDLGEKFLKGEFNLIDLYKQIESVKKMGPLTKVLSLVPGFGSLNVPKEMLEMQDAKLDKWRHIFNSMTKEELEDPSIIDLSRMERIAKGAGVPVSEVRDILKYYKQSKKVIKLFKGKNPKQLEKMAKKLGVGNLNL